ncbi:uncharacterized protein LOC141630258 [Silene latifolia]|uniref:uncharacterized protein LOC141630258 n=1 Tax=Silene latifolia TaxID=37657 RepID=UPI003D7769C9
MIEFRYNGDGYVVFHFREWHNYRLCSLRNQQFQKKHRHLHLYNKKTIIDHSRVNQGQTTAFRNVKEYVDGYENVGAQLVDFKNFRRDIKYFIGDRDAQLYVNHFEDKRDANEGFYFAYEVDSGKCLVRAFWCDAESRRNYSLFGDYITYDPTYSTNKYFMVFTPFTGVDHHKKSVTFAGAFLFHEDEDSFKWVFEKFLDAMGHREPHCIITDQYAGIKKETDFVNHLNAIVWDDELEPLEFEEKSSQLVNEHNLEDFHLEATASICSLSIGGFTPPANGIEVIGIADARTQKTYQVVYNSTTNDAEYSSKLFNIKGIICRHIIWVYSVKQVDTLPDNSSTEVRILPPRQAKNKGSGKRMISRKQQCIAKAEKPKTLCRNCKQMAYHDKRNCPNAFIPDTDNKGSSDEDDADDS